MNPAHQSIAAPPAAVGSSDDLMLMDCDVPQFPQPVNVPLQPQLPLPPPPPPTGEPRESRGFESLQSSLSTLPGKLADPIPFLPLWVVLTCHLLSFSALSSDLLGWGNNFSIFGLSAVFPDPPLSLFVNLYFSFFVTSCYFPFRWSLPPYWNNAANGGGGGGCRAGRHGLSQGPLQPRPRGQ